MERRCKYCLSAYAFYISVNSIFIPKSVASSVYYCRHICSEYDHPSFDPFTQPISRSFVGFSSADPLFSHEQINNLEQSLMPSFHLLPLPVVFAIVAVFSVVAANIRFVQASGVADADVFIVFFHHHLLVEAGLGRLEFLYAPRAPHADQAILAVDGRRRSGEEGGQKRSTGR